MISPVTRPAKLSKTSIGTAGLFGNTWLESTKEEKETIDKDQTQTAAGATDQTGPREAKPKLTDEEKKLIRGIIKTGAVKFGMGISIEQLPEIRRLTQTKKAGAQEGMDQGMAPLSYNVITYAVYAMPFFVNPSTGRKSGCTEEDIELMLRHFSWLTRILLRLSARTSTCALPITSSTSLLWSIPRLRHD